MEGDITNHSPLRLGIAAKIAFPDGSMTASGLRREKERGRLATMRVAGKDYTTLADITEMLKQCREPRKAPDSGTENLATTRRRASCETEEPGSSEMALNLSPLDALLQKLDQLKKN
ncbi:excisionase [Methylobacterium sp. SD274]|uniref:excisionase n=1 Tax=Methylobacterium sp. SD274 TaxID=2782009 RepID=UPI001FEE0863|nr:excisionase [Methylobacterium sp. SD274]